MSPGLAEPHRGSTRELLEARIRNPKTSARDLAALVNSLAKLEGEDTGSSDSMLDAARAAARIFPPGTLVLEPVRGPEWRFRLMRRVPGGFEHIDNSLTARQAWSLIGCALVSASPDEFGTSREELAAKPDQQ